MARRRKPSGRLTRRSATKPVQPEIVVVCEGRTEAEVINGLRQRWRIPSARVIVVDDGGVPKSVVARAIAEKERILGCIPGRERQDYGLQVWAVFDRDEHPGWLDAICRADAQGINLAISNPCFELWGLLLQEDQTAHIERRDAQRRLSTIHSGYDHNKSKYLDMDIVEANLDSAGARANVNLSRAVAAGDRVMNPTTSFSDLVAALQSLKG